MTTMFDIGDKITLQMTGEVVEYSASKDGDCYIIELRDPNGKSDPTSRNRLHVYLETNDLKLCGAKLVSEVKDNG